MPNPALPITLCQRSRLSGVDFDHLGFGDVFSDHMFRCEFTDGRWHSAQIVPYGPIAMEPGALCLHYGQAVFEGLKAFRGVDGVPRIFRPDRNADRLEQSCARLCIPPIDQELFCSAIEQLVTVDEKWLPQRRGESLYIRPLVFATEPNLLVKASDRYLFLIITAPVKGYFSTTDGGVSLRAEPNYTRAAMGGTGFAKTGGNYAATLRPGTDSVEQGFDQTLWLDSRDHCFVEEVGQMNIFFKIGDTFVTPPLKGTILPGVTRESVLTLLKDHGEKFEERPVSMEEVILAYDRGDLQEVFGAGTAAVIAPVSRISYGEKTLNFDVSPENLASKWLYQTIVDIQTGVTEDIHGWNRIVRTDANTSRPVESVRF